MEGKKGKEIQEHTHFLCNSAKRNSKQNIMQKKKNLRLWFGFDW